MVLVVYPNFLADPLSPPTLPLLVVIAHFLAPHGLGHSLHIPCNVDTWLDLYPFFRASWCSFFFTAIYCGTLLGTNFVMLMAYGYVAAVDAPSCSSCDLLCDIVSLLNFCCWSPPSRFLRCDRWMHNPLAADGPIVATAQYPSLPCFPFRCFLAMSPPRNCAVHPLPPKNSSSRWSTRYHGPDCTGILLLSCAALQPVRIPTATEQRGPHLPWWRGISYHY